MRKVLNVMLKVILWLVSCIVTIVGCRIWTFVGEIGSCIKYNGYKYLNESRAEDTYMSCEDYMSLDESKQDTVWKKACSDAYYMRKTGQKWWME